MLWLSVLYHHDRLSGPCVNWCWLDVFLTESLCPRLRHLHLVLALKVGAVEPLEGLSLDVPRHAVDTLQLPVVTLSLPQTAPILPSCFLSYLLCCGSEVLTFPAEIQENLLDFDQWSGSLTQDIHDMPCHDIEKFDIFNTNIYLTRHMRTLLTFLQPPGPSGMRASHWARLR